MDMLEKCLRIIFWKTQHQMYHCTSILWTIHIYLDLYVIDLGRNKQKKKEKKKKVKYSSLIVNAAFFCLVQFTICPLVPHSVYLNITLSLGPGGDCFGWFLNDLKNRAAVSFLRASQTNTGLRIILLTKPQRWLWSVKLKISIILALCVFPGDDSCNYDSPFLMYTKKVEAVRQREHG